MLVNKSLIRALDPDDKPGTEHQSRYEMPEVLRQYAGEHLEANGMAPSTAQAHAAFLEAFLRSLATELRSGDQHGALAQIAAEIENLRFAQLWSVTHVDDEQTKPAALSYLQACTRGLFDFYDIRGWFQEGASRFGDAADACETCRRMMRAGIRGAASGGVERPTSLVSVPPRRTRDK